MGVTRDATGPNRSTSPWWRPRRPWLVILVSMVLAAASSLLVVPASAAPGSPGTPSAPTTVYTEDFQNVSGPSPILRLTGYTGATGQKYTADPAWLSNCNGWVAAAGQSPTSSAQISDCAGQQYSWNQSQQLAQALGMYKGQTPVQALGNYAVTAYTAGSPGAGKVEFQTASNIPFSAANRFIAFSADVAAVNCWASAPQLQFQLLNGSGVATNAGSQVTGCGSGSSIVVGAIGVADVTTVNVATATSNGAVLFSGSSIGIRLINNNGSGTGNDHTFDNIKVLDVTPQLDKSFSPTSVKTGDTSTLTFTITNTSELGSKNGWSFTDQLPSGLKVASPNGATTTCSAGAVTAPAGGGSIAVSGNLNQGQTSCTVSVKVTADAPGDYTNGPSNVTTNGLNPPGSTTATFSNPLISVVKHAGTPVDVNGNGITDAGDTIQYTFDVSNPGDVPLTAVGVTDAKVGTVSCPSSTLAAGASEVCTADSVYTVTAADVTAGSVNNTATAHGTDPAGKKITSSPSTTTTPTTAPDPRLTIVKSASPSTAAEYVAGQAITYTFVLTNTGNVPLDGVTVNDTGFSGTGTMSAISCPAEASTLSVGEQASCTATYTLTQADVDAGSLQNSATATGTPPGGTPVTSPPSEVQIPVDPATSISLVKSASPTTVATVGATVDYSFLVTNTGNVTLTDPVVTETGFTGTGSAPVVSCPTGPLAPGASTTCTASYVVTQADIDAGSVTNTATVTATPPAGVTAPVSDPSTAIISATASADLSLVKSVTPGTVSAVGDKLSYSFLVTNTGNVTLTDVAINEGAFSGTGTAPVVSCPAEAASLAPGASVTCTATYSVTQADLDAGSVSNTATATGTPPGGGTPPVSPPSTTTVDVNSAPSLTLVKSASPTTVGAAGDKVTYSFLVTNTGNVTVTDPTITETAFSGSGTAPVASCPTGALAPGASVTCTATYAVTQADVDAGSVTNTATATATPPLGVPAPVSDPSSASVTATSGPALTLVKSATPGTVGAVGDTVTYSFLVTNTGNVTVTDVTINEGAFSGTGTAPSATCPAEAASLAPGESVTCTATYVVTQADLDAGSISNTATATGTPPGGGTPPVSPPSTTTVDVDAAPALTLVKSASPTTVNAAGDTVTYSFLVTNTGNVTVSDPTITETAFSGTGTAPVASCPTGPLAPGASVTCTATYVVTQADIDAGSISNTATATATPPAGVTPPVSPPSSTTVTVEPAPALTLVKSATPGTVSAVGDTVTYSFLVTNTGNVTVTDVTINEGAFSGTGSAPVVSCPAEAASLAPGASVSCTATYVVTQADLDAGSISNTATATGTPPGGGTPPVSPPSTTTVDVNAAPALTLVKSATPATIAAVGDTVTYSFLVTNTGNVTVSDPTITETAFSGTGTVPVASCPTGPLAPGASVTCTATYVVTQADVDAGSVTNTATATATPPVGVTPPVSDPSSATVTASPSPALTLVKSATPGTVGAVGDTVTYSFLVTNTGNVTVTDVTINEGAFSGTGTAPVVSCPAEAASLAPGATVTCTATYVVTQADLDAGSVSNTATATGTPPGGGTPPVSPPSTTTVDVNAAPALTLVKSATPATIAAVGDTVTYSFLVTNTGNVTVSDPTITETAFSGTGTAPVASCPTGPLAPGASVTCTATYVVTQADIDAGSISNTATATATPPAGVTPPVSDPSSATVTATSAPALTLVKSATPATVAAAGDTVTYSFLVTNTGNVTVTDVTINEGAFSGTGTAPVVSCPAEAASLAPGASVTCTATYVVTQADLDAGSISNTATATATPPGGGTPPVSPPSTTTVDVDAAPALSLVKSASPTTVGAAGNTVTYSFLVTNTGNVTVTDPTITETAFSGTGTAPVVSCPTGPLAPGASTTCTATYVVTQADVDAGSVTNTATATATPPAGVTPPVSDPSSASVTATAGPALSLVKSATPGTVSAVGDTVTYSFLVTNTGNVTLTDVTIDEGAFSGTGTAPVVSCPAEAASLAPGASVTCTATYVVTQADLDAGSVSNTATATATPPGGGTPPVSPPSTTTVEVNAAPALSLVKSATPTTIAAAGDTVTYSFQVTNTGNVTVTDVTINESAFTGTGTAPVVSCPAEAASLAPGATVTCTATYVVTQADIDAGSVSNTATATATPPGGGTPPVSPPSSTTVTAQPAPSLTVVKSATPGTVSAVGDTVTYSFLVTNTGNVTLTDVTINEGAFSGTGTAPVVSCPAGASSLAPGATVTCTATYVVTQADLDAGSISNTATATGTPPGGGTPPVSPPSTTTVDVDAAPALTLVKSASPTSVGAAGGTVTYSFLVTNTGNVTVTDPTITETAFSGTGTAPVASCPTGPLAPGASVTCTATYVVTQADVDAGSVTNTATATATPPAGVTPPVSDPSSATVTATSAPAITVVKSADTTAITKAGQTVTYSFLVTNTGNVTLSNVTVNEGTFSGTGTAPVVSCPAEAASLTPGASVTCTATYVVTQADLDAAASISNSATAGGTPPGSETPVVSEPSTVTIPVEPVSSLSLVKSASPSGGDLVVGQKVTYTFVVTNTGNVTVHDVVVKEGEFTGSGKLAPPTCPSGDLKPGAQLECTTTYTLTQADVDRGTVSNRATATGTPPGTIVPPVSPPSDVIIPSPSTPSVSLVKTADTAKITRAGQKVTYTFVVTNTGNVTVTDPTINEVSFSGKGTMTAPVCPALATGLAPGQKVVCHATYTAVAADLTGKNLTNTATATVTAPDGTPVTSDPSTVVLKTVPPKDPGQLAFTGATVGWGVGGLAVALMGLGGALIAVRRRHSSDR